MSSAATTPRPTDADLLVVGGGIVGLATAYQALQARPGTAVMVVDKEPRIASHQTGRNSGVIHSGVYYPPGSTKARLCTAGRAELVEFCQRHAIAFEMTGKVIVAATLGEVASLSELRRRGERNGVRVSRIGPEGLAEVEPAARGVAALHVADAGIVDFPAVAETLAAQITRAGGVVRTGVRVHALRPQGTGVAVETDGGTLRAGRVVNCAGLHADRLARSSGVRSPVSIVPFRGEYYVLADDRRDLCRGLIYPVPDPRYPFLGVHLTRTIHGEVLAGPNAVLALSREGYRWSAVEPADVLSLVSDPGLWRLVARHWRTGLAELRRSLSREAFARSLRVLVPAVTAADLRPARAGVRAQALRRDGSLVQDFEIVQVQRCVHVLNAPSPAATSALAIGQEVAGRALAGL